MHAVEDKIRCNPMHPLYGALPVPYVPVRVTRGALIEHRYHYLPARCRTSQGIDLFLIHISNINYEIADSRVLCFADNTRILLGIKDEEDTQMLQNDLHKLYKWEIQII